MTLEAPVKREPVYLPPSPHQEHMLALAAITAALVDIHGMLVKIEKRCGRIK